MVALDPAPIHFVLWRSHSILGTHLAQFAVLKSLTHYDINFAKWIPITQHMELWTNHFLKSPSPVAEQDNRLTLVSFPSIMLQSFCRIGRFMKVSP